MVSLIPDSEMKQAFEIYKDMLSSNKKYTLVCHPLQLMLTAAEMETIIVSTYGDLIQMTAMETKSPYHTIVNLMKNHQVCIWYAKRSYWLPTDKMDRC